MQKSNLLKFQVLKGDGEILASLAYPKGTKVYQVFQDVQKKIEKSKGTTQPHIILRSSKGVILQPHKHLETFLHIPHGDHLVVEFVSSEGGQSTRQNMKQGGHNKAASHNPVVICDKKRTLSDRGKTSWGSYKIPKKHSDKVTKVNSTPWERSRRDNGSNNVKNSGDKCKSNAVGTTSVDSAVVANSALGSLIQNYSNDDDDDEESDDEVVFNHDIRGGTVKRTESNKIRTRADAADDSCAIVETSFKLKSNSDDDFEVINRDVKGSASKRTESNKKRTRADTADHDYCVKVESASSKRTKKGSNKSKQTEIEATESSKSSGSSSSFTQGVGLFLQSLKSESEKPKQELTRISVGRNADLDKSTKEWPLKSIRTYSRQSPRLNATLTPPTSTWDADVGKTDSSTYPRQSQRLNNTLTPPISHWDADSSILPQDDTDASATSKKVHAPVLSPISHRTRSSIGSANDSMAGSNTRDDGNAKDGEDDDDDMWQKDVVLLSIQCKGSISNRQLASCINGIFLDLQADNPAKYESLTLDELQKKLETVYQKDLSDKRKCIDYVYQKLRRDGPKQRKAASEVVTVGKITLTNDDFYTLADHMWLNDNIINAYMFLMTSTSKQRVFAHSTFFYSNLTRKNKGYESVKRWTDQVDLFAYDMVLVPVHIRNHWTLAAIHVQKHRIEYYNSLGSTNKKVFGVLVEYLRKEATTRERHLFTALKWDTGFMKNLPQQKNGSDCGVYVCQYAKRLCFGKPVKFTTMESMCFREEMVKELVDKKLKDTS